MTINFSNKWMLQHCDLKITTMIKHLESTLVSRATSMQAHLDVFYHVKQTLAAWMGELWQIMTNRIWAYRLSWEQSHERSIYLSYFTGDIILGRSVWNFKEAFSRVYVVSCSCHISLVTHVLAYTEKHILHVYLHTCIHVLSFFCVLLMDGYSSI